MCEQMVDCMFFCRFKEAFLLDCDVILHKDPAYMFEAPLYKERGNYFWDDIYGYGMVKDEVYEYVGGCPQRALDLSCCCCLPLWPPHPAAPVSCYWDSGMVPQVRLL